MFEFSAIKTLVKQELTIYCSYPSWYSLGISDCCGKEGVCACEWMFLRMRISPGPHKATLQLSEHHDEQTATLSYWLQHPKLVDGHPQRFHVHIKKQKREHSVCEWLLGWSFYPNNHLVWMVHWGRRGTTVEQSFQFLILADDPE